LGAAPEEGKPLLSRNGITDLTCHWNTYGEEWQVNDVDQALPRHEPSSSVRYPESCEYVAEMKKSYFRRRLLMDSTNNVSLETTWDACVHLEEDHMKDFCMNHIQLEQLKIQCSNTTISSGIADEIEDVEASVVLTLRCMTNVYQALQDFHNAISTNLKAIAESSVEKKR
jgi:hypothetical protein